MIYFDNASTTKPIGSPHLFHNPSSPHALGIIAERALRDSRSSIALILNNLKPRFNKKIIPDFSVSPDEITFTSGGTESNNLAILGYALSNLRKGSTLVSSSYEHPSITAPINFASARQWASTALLDMVPSSGNVLVSISQVNHETGDINEVSNLATNVKIKNPEAVIHVDGSQGFCKERINLDSVDMYSFSGHKCHGPVGVGGLWVGKGIALSPLAHGGGQEKGLRSGTENVAGIVQMTEAVEGLSQSIEENYSHVSEIKKTLSSLRDDLPDVMVNSLGETISPYILNMSFLGVKGEVLVHALSEKGLYVSMGAACHSRKSSYSALELMGFSSDRAMSAIRFSFSPYNTLEEAECARELVIAEVMRFRKMKGFK